MSIFERMDVIMKNNNNDYQSIFVIGITWVKFVFRCVFTFAFVWAGSMVGLVIGAIASATILPHINAHMLGMFVGGLVGFVIKNIIANKVTKEVPVFASSSDEIYVGSNRTQIDASSDYYLNQGR